MIGGVHVGTCRMKEGEMKVWVCLSARRLDGCTGPKTGPMREAHKGCGWMRPVPQEMYLAIGLVVDAINDLDTAIEAGGDIADESDELYESARELRGQVALAQASQVGESE